MSRMKWPRLPSPRSQSMTRTGIPAWRSALIKASVAATFVPALMMTARSPQEERSEKAWYLMRFPFSCRRRFQAGLLQGSGESPPAPGHTRNDNSGRARPSWAPLFDLPPEAWFNRGPADPSRKACLGGFHHAPHGTRRITGLPRSVINTSAPVLTVCRYSLDRDFGSARAAVGMHIPPMSSREHSSQEP